MCTTSSQSQHPFPAPALSPQPLRSSSQAPSPRPLSPSCQPQGPILPALAPSPLSRVLCEPCSYSLEPGSVLPVEEGPQVLGGSRVRHGTAAGEILVSRHVDGRWDRCCCCCCYCCLGPFTYSPRTLVRYINRVVKWLKLARPRAHFFLHIRIPKTRAHTICVLSYPSTHNVL